MEDQGRLMENKEAGSVIISRSVTLDIPSWLLHQTNTGHSDLPAPELPFSYHCKPSTYPASKTKLSQGHCSWCHDQIKGEEILEICRQEVKKKEGKEAKKRKDACLNYLQMLVRRGIQAKLNNIKVELSV